MYNDGGASSGSKVMVSRSHMVVSLSVCSPYDQNENPSFLPQLPKKTPNDPLESRCSCFRDNCDAEVARFVSSVFCCYYGFDYDPCTSGDFHCLSVCCMTIVTLKLPDLSAA